MAPIEQGIAPCHVWFHTPPKYRLHKGTQQAIAQFCGRRIYLGVYGSEKSYRRYREVLKEWREFRRQQQPEPAQRELSADELVVQQTTAEILRTKWKQGLDVSVYELIVIYLRHAKLYYRKQGEITREAGQIEEVLLPLGKKHGRDNVEEFGPVDLDNFRDDLIVDFDWSRKYINKQIVRVIGMFKWGAQKEVCSANIHAQLATLGGLKKGRTKARETTGVTCVSDAVVKKTLPHLPEIVADMVRFQLLTGARPGEVCSVRPADVEQSGDVWLYRPNAHKTEHYEKDRLVAIGPLAQKVLLPYLARTSKSYCFSPAESVQQRRERNRRNRKTPESCGNTVGSNRQANPKRVAGDRYQVSSYRHAVRRACKVAEVAIWTPNQLRHTAATKIRRKFGLEAAQVVCGHQSADVTQVYAERDLSLAKNVAKAVG